MGVPRSPSMRAFKVAAPPAPDAISYQTNPFLALPSVAVGALFHVFTHVASATRAMGQRIGTGAQNALLSVTPECHCACMVHRRAARNAGTVAGYKCAACGGRISSASDIFMALDQATCSDACQREVAGGWETRLPDSILP